VSVGSFIGSIVKGPAADLISSIGNTIKQFVTTDADRLAASERLAQIQANFEIAIAQADEEFAKAQQAVIVAEAEGQSWLQRNWRPMMMLFFAVVIGWIVWTGGFVNNRELNPSFVMEILSIIKVGLGGYVIGRSAEKIIPDVADIFNNKNKK
jgi:hypothetical protein